MQKTKTIATVQQLADELSYSDQDQLEKEASDANLLVEIAGVPHICREDWEDYTKRTFFKQVGKRSKSSKTLSDTKQVGIVKSNLKRLPTIIEKKERRLKAVKALLKTASSTDEKWSLSNEKSRLQDDLSRHKDNLHKAEESMKRIQTERSAALDDLESGDNSTQSDDESSEELQSGK